MTDGGLAFAVTIEMVQHIRYLRRCPVGATGRAGKMLTIQDTAHLPAPQHFQIRRRDRSPRRMAPK